MIIELPDDMKAIELRDLVRYLEQKGYEPSIKGKGNGNIKIILN